MTSKNLNIKYIDVEQLEVYANNARIHSKQQIKQIARSIKAFGFINPVLVDADNRLVAGHGRLLAAKSIGLKTIPCIRIDHLSEDEKRAYILADNKLAENAGWDPDLLKVELSYLSQVDVDIDVELTGFAMPEIDIIMGTAQQSNEETPAPSLAPLEEAVSQLGDLWQLGPHRLICGDCRDPHILDNLMSGEQANLVCTDPPYNVSITTHARGLGKDKHTNFAMACGEMSEKEFTEFLGESLNALNINSFDRSLHYVFMDWRHMAELLAAGNTVYDELINLCIWNKSSGGMGSFYRSKHELVFVFKKGKASHINNIELGKHGRYRTNVWDCPGVNSFGEGRDEALSMHPTVKPVRLIADVILDASKRGDIILDGFAGSGSTLLAAHDTDRIFYGVEIDPRYVDVTLKRWITYTGEQPIHVASGQSFEARSEQLTHQPICAEA